MTTKGFDLCGLLSTDTSILEIKIERCFKHKNVHTCDSTSSQRDDVIACQVALGNSTVRSWDNESVKGQ